MKTVFIQLSKGGSLIPQVERITAEKAARETDVPIIQNIYKDLDSVDIDFKAADRIELENRCFTSSRSYRFSI